MEKKPSIIYVLIGLWIVLIILFTGTQITYTANYIDQQNTRSSYSFADDQWDTLMNFNFVMYFLLYLAVIMVGVIVLYGTFFKKAWAWFISITLSSFVGFFAFMGIYSIGTTIIMDRLDTLFSTMYSSFTFVTYLLMIFFVPCLLFILTRSTVKTYFGKT